jgi:V/A-type H+-transporting ATPase subunit D
MELREERQVIEEGYRFLDEKRLLLAAEMLRQLEEYQRLYTSFDALNQQAAQAMAAAVERHGLEGLQLHPARPLDDAELEVGQRSFLGVRLLESTLQLPAQLSPEQSAIDPSPEARRCTELFRELIPLSARLAGLSGNLERLMAEYQRTERRARALEDVILPEVKSLQQEIGTRLEEMDQEEAIRVRLKYGE